MNYELRIGVGKGLFFKHRALTDASSFVRCPKLFLRVNITSLRAKITPELMDFLKTCKAVKVKSVYSHLAASDDPDCDEFTLGQISLFKVPVVIPSPFLFKPQ